MLYRDMIEQIGSETPFATVKTMIEFLLSNKLVTPREAELVARTAANLYQSEAAGELSSDERAKLIRSIFVTLAEIT